MVFEELQGEITDSSDVDFLDNHRMSTPVWLISWRAPPMQEMPHWQNAEIFASGSASSDAEPANTPWKQWEFHELLVVESWIKFVQFVLNLRQ